MRLVSIRDVADVRGGYWGEGQPTPEAKIAVAVVRNGDLSRDGQLKGSAARYFTESEANRSSLAEGDLALTTSGEIGKTHLVESEGLFASNFVKRIRVNQGLVTPKYLWYALRSPLAKDQLARYTSGSTIANLKTGFFAEEWIPLPSVNEQMRIVSKLDAVLEQSSRFDFLNASVRALIKDLEARYLELPLRKLSGAKMMALDEVADIVPGFTFKSAEYAESGHFLMRIRNVQDGVLTLAEPVFVSLARDPKLSRFDLMSGDLLVSLTGNIGRVGQVQHHHLPAAVNQRVARIRAHSNLMSSDFLFLLLLLPAFRNELSASGHGAAQSNVSPSAVRNYEVPVPSLQVQDEIVKSHAHAYAALSALESAVDREQVLVQELESALLVEALAGFQ